MSDPSPVFLKSLSIENFKGFFKKQSLEFAIPNGEEGSGLTILVGPNNSGKSSVFQALLKLDHSATLPTEEKNAAGLPHIVITDTDNKTREASIDKESGDFFLSGFSDISRDRFHYIPCRRDFKNSFRSAIDRKTYYIREKNPSDVNGYDMNLPLFLNNINKFSGEKPLLTGQIRSVIPNFANWKVESKIDGTYFIKYIETNGTEHDFSLCGRGILNLLKLSIEMLPTSSNNILLVDEPELSLHPQAQKSLAKALISRSANNQIIISTHSPYFINVKNLTSRGRLIRLSKNTGACKTYQLSCANLNKLGKSIEDFCKPEFFDLVAKELFFSDAILLLEGKDDAGVIRNYLETTRGRYNFDIWGYGSGGAQNIKHLLQICQDLEIKAGALFDRNKESEAIFCKISFPQFADGIKVLPTDEIRDEPGKDIVGIFNRTNGINDQYKDFFEDLIEGFLTYFSQ